MVKRLSGLSRDRPFFAFSRIENTTGFPVDAWVFASDTPRVTDRQVISLSQKNWRLNGLLPGDLVVNPGDVLLCQILGDDAPAAERIPSGVGLAVVREGEQGHACMVRATRLQCHGR